ncbi:Lrp/AsnC family transcriptional regulator [Harryflintia acetispora]|uniref:Lrp/AsnC family transcriptional regulator n=1 Tax=Harryflintia acetispora TaxID=1849041 RepID=UPI0018995210|nr:Lrp/AsnC family transcriptional regulator [Harryflintia acetispora]
MKLLRLLEENSRLSLEQLATMTGMKAEEVAAELERYEREGIIRSYGAIIDWDKTERHYVSALIELRVSPKRDCGFEEIAKTIMEFPEVESVYLMSGGYDLAVTVSGESFKDIAMFVAYRLSPLDSVLSTATHFVLRRYKERGVVLCEEEGDEREVTVL